MATTNELDPRSSATRPVPGSTGATGSTIGAGSTTGSSTESGSAFNPSDAAGPNDSISQGRGNGGAVDTVLEAADAVKERANAIWDDAREAARAKLSEQKDEAADGLGEVAGALRDAAQRQRGDSSRRPIAQLTGSAADGLERLSSTLRSKDVGSMVRDVENFARNQPVAFFGLALATGFLAARFFKSSND